MEAQGADGERGRQCQVSVTQYLWSFYRTQRFASLPVAPVQADAAQRTLRGSESEVTSIGSMPINSCENRSIFGPVSKNNVCDRCITAWCMGLYSNVM